MTTKKLTKDIYEAVGGSSNINSVMHCMTRLRLRLTNEGLVNDEAVKALDGVQALQIAMDNIKSLLDQVLQKYLRSLHYLGTLRRLHKLKRI